MVSNGDAHVNRFPQTGTRPQRISREAKGEAAYGYVWLTRPSRGFCVCGLSLVYGACVCSLFATSHMQNAYSWDACLFVRRRTPQAMAHRPCPLDRPAPSSMCTKTKHGTRH